MKQKIIILFITLFITSFYGLSVSAQATLTDVKVDQLSDAQILKIMKDGESIGYTSQAQLEQMALAKGMKPEEIQKFKLRVEKLKGQGTATQAENKTINTGREYSETTGGGSVTNQKEEKNNEVTTGIFGSELFKNGNITFEPNLRIATPKSYVIGPDDKLIIDLNGDNEASYNLGVNPEGVISLPYVGRIYVSGLTIEQATSKIKNLMAKTYTALNTGKTSLAVNLGNIRSIKVTITGQATRTGTFTLSSLSSVYNALNACGGPSANGTYRNIQLIRNKKVIATIDVYNFLLKGIQQSDIRLQDQDVINIPVYEKRIGIAGEIKLEAQYEIVKNETLGDVINFAGGYTTQAYTAKIKSFQNTDRERKIVDIPASEVNGYIPKNGDQFVVEAILDRFENRVEIIGSVFRPGSYELEKGITLKGLITKADGLTEDAFVNRAYINRLNPDNTQRLISFDLAKIMDGSSTDILLQREDKVIINSLFDLRDEYRVSVQGEVRLPGTFEYAENMTLESVIQLAGGFKEGAKPDHVDISRRVKNSDAKSSSAVTAEVFTIAVDQNLKLSGEAFILKPFDIVTIRNAEGYEVQRQVLLEGEVVNPGPYTIIRKNEKISEIINRAGGLTSSAYAEGASLKRPGAEKVNPGSKNAIRNQEEENKKIANLSRVQENGAGGVEQQLIQSDIVGINLVEILKKPLSKLDLIVEEGDVIRVPRQLQTVRVTGEILNPNNIVYLKGKSFRQYINGAGGFTSSALKKGAYVKYANGSIESVKKFLVFNNYPVIKPGAEIMVPKKAEKERLNAQSWIGIGTGLASLAAIIVTLLR
jgi:protein involved in polysaccharide export with SLBB domain